MEFLQAAWTFLNSPLGIGTMAALVLWLLNFLYGKKPDWQKYEGTIISAIKLAEKEIPDDVSNKSLSKLDSALRYVLRVYTEANNKRPTQDVIDNIREGIQIKHAELETAGALKK